MRYVPVFLFIALFLTACAIPQVQVANNTTRLPELAPDFAIMPDDYRLPLKTWAPQQEVKSLVLALHGFNDYRNAFSGVGPRLAERGILTVAYDQRGFGETEQRGVWAGSDRLESDAVTLAQLMCEKYPGVPLYLMGESMGGAVVMTATRFPLPDCVSGIILLAPAVWGWQAMPLWQQAALWLAVHVAPGQKLTGEGLDITPSDNIEMLRALGKDPLVIKETRIDTVFGLTNQMEAALLSSSDLKLPALILYGQKDEIIPAQATCQMLAGLPPGQSQFVLYPDGYHMLTRDLQADVVLKDMAAWLTGTTRELPSGLETESKEAQEKLDCYR